MAYSGPYGAVLKRWLRPEQGLYMCHLKGTLTWECGGEPHKNISAPKFLKNKLLFMKHGVLRQKVTEERAQLGTKI
jgi:hypothetical protein